MRLKTDQLSIIPLTLQQFYLFTKDIAAMEKELGLYPSGKSLDEHTKEAMLWLYNEAASNVQAHIWYTNWQIVLNSENKSIGSAGFKGPPISQHNFEVEIGYGIDAKYQCKGYATEAIKAMIAWAAGQDGVKDVIAETDKGNIASERVLRKCPMRKYNETDHSILWRQI